MKLPDRIGRFRVLDFLGRGAMGVVYRGLDEALDRQVALKVMAGQGLDPDARARFKREAQAAGRLQHPNIITIYELGEHEGALFMALELIEGIDLQRAIEGGVRPDPKVTLPVVLQLLAGLGHAHEHGIVHRDVKPSNLFLPRNRPAKIMDFGVARLAGGGLTTAGMVVGTPNYMSPEQVRAAGDLDGRSDLFSSGLILYELVTGEKAYRANSIVSLMYKIAHEDPDLSLIPKGREWETLRGVIERALRHDADERYPDAPAMASDLARALRELGGVADWATSSNAGLLMARPAQPRAIELGTAPPAPTMASAPTELGTLADEAPPETVFLGTAKAEPATAPAPAPAPTAELRVPATTLAETPAVPAAAKRSPFLLAAALGVAAVAILVVAFLASRPKAPAAEGPLAKAAPASLEAPGTSPASPPAAAAAGPKPAPPTPAPTPRVATTPAPTMSAAPPIVRAPPPREPAVEAPPVSPSQARIDRADALLQSGKFAAALAEARAVLHREPGNADAQVIAEEAEASLLIESCLKKARQALDRGDKDAAVEELKKGLAANPSDARLIKLWREATQ